MPGSKPTAMIPMERDRKLARAMAAVGRIVDRQQVAEIAGFGSVRRANHRLLTLTRAGFLRRFFVGTLAGGRKALYTLSPKGAALAGCESYSAVSHPQERLLVSSSFVEHQLSLNWIWIQAAYRRIPQPAARFVRWLRFNQPIAKSIPLVPDGYFEIEHHQQIHPLFCEVDRGTETLRVWERKVSLYLKLAMSGDFEKRFCQPRFRVLVVACSERRMHGIRKTVLKQTDRIFRFTTLDQINREGLWASIWRRPEGNQSTSLL